MIAEKALPYGLRARPLISLGTYYQVPYMTLTELQYAIRQALSSCESITLFEWNQDEFSYTIEYASRPIEETVPPDLLGIVYRKKNVATSAANEAYIRFPDNIDNYLDLDLDFAPILQYPKRWSRTKLSIFWDERNNCLCIETLRFKGDRCSSIYIRDFIWKHFDKICEIQTALKYALVEAGVDIESTNLRTHLECDANLRDYLVCDLV